MTTGLTHILIPALWLAWLLYWILAARNVKATRWHESRGSRAIGVLPLLIAGLLLSAPQLLPPPFRERFAPAGAVLPWAATIVTAAGLGLAAWARTHLGRNWSGTVTLKEDHALIRTGPYRSLRHPIYTGILVGFVGTALAIGEWRGVLAIFFVVPALLWRIRVEERRMVDTFPEYREYRRESWALVPFLY